MTSNREMGDAEKALGNEEFNNKNFEKSIEHYTKAIEHDGEHHVYFSNRSAAYASLNKWELAEKDASRCIQLNPQFGKGYARLANAQRHLKRSGEAMKTLEAGRAIDPSHGEINRLYREMKKENSAALGNHGQQALPPAVAKELGELQPQYQNAHRELEQISYQIQALQRDRKRSELTNKDVGEMPEDTVMYQSVGKMFIQNTKEVMCSKLEQDVASMDTKVAALESRKVYLERQKDSLEANITELLSQCMTKKE